MLVSGFQLCMPLYENVKLQFIQKAFFLFKISYILVSSKTFLNLACPDNNGVLILNISTSQN